MNSTKPQRDFTRVFGHRAKVVNDIAMQTKARLGDHSNAFLGGSRLWKSRSSFALGRLG